MVLCDDYYDYYDYCDYCDYDYCGDYCNYCDYDYCDCDYCEQYSN